MLPLCLIFDVDGVVRRGITSVAEPGVTRGIKQLLSMYDAAGCSNDIRIVFLSGTTATVPPVFRDAVNENAWRLPNRPLSDVFESDPVYVKELAAGRVAIVGQLGANPLVLADPASPASSSAAVHSTLTRGLNRLEATHLCAAILHNYCRSLRVNGMADMATWVETETDTVVAAIEAECSATPGTAEQFCRLTPDEFESVVKRIRGDVDPMFKVIFQGATAEFQDYRFAEDAAAMARRPVAEVVGNMRNAIAADRRLAPLGLSASGGVAHSDGAEFVWCSVVLMTKGEAVESMLVPPQAPLAASSGGSSVSTASFFYDLRQRQAPLVTFGDSSIDFPMHALADASFHLGPREALRAAVSLYPPAVLDHVRLVLGTRQLAGGHDGDPFHMDDVDAARQSAIASPPPEDFATRAAAARQDRQFCAGTERVLAGICDALATAAPVKQREALMGLLSGRPSSGLVTEAAPPKTDR